ncbi:hypothetical protein E4T56_gene16009 [Termitomyces sp. T112]|nr:hypothetical protein E4T56_gene16009 [Termitomyces sp. T112]
MPHSTTGVSPFYANKGYNPWLTLSLKDISPTLPTKLLKTSSLSTSSSEMRSTLPIKHIPSMLTPATPHAFSLPLPLLGTPPPWKPLSTLSPPVLLSSKAPTTPSFSLLLAPSAGLTVPATPAPPENTPWLSALQLSAPTVPHLNPRLLTEAPPPMPPAARSTLHSLLQELFQY